MGFIAIGLHEETTAAAAVAAIWTEKQQETDSRLSGGDVDRRNKVHPLCIVYPLIV